MRVHASKEELEGLPDWSADFLARAWAPPDQNGQRAPLRDFEGADGLLHRVSDRISDALQDRAKSNPYFRLSVSPAGPHVGFLPFWKDRTVEIAYNLAFAWQRGGSLAECVVCGNLMEPDKGRVARTCSDACRLALHRQKKET
jgi:hypothetical protein